MRNPSTMCPCTSAPTSRCVRTAPHNIQHAAGNRQRTVQPTAGMHQASNKRHAAGASVPCGDCRSRTHGRTRPHGRTRSVRGTGKGLAACRVVRVRQQRPVRLFRLCDKVSWAFTTKDYDITILVVRDDDGKETQVRTDRTDGARRRTSPGRTHRVAWYSRAAALPVRDRDELYPKPSLHAPPPTLPAPYTLICLHGMASASGSASSAQSGVARGVYTASPTCKTDFSGHDDQSIKTCRRRWWRRRRSSRT
jgi:hypothetical protein